MDPDGLTIDRDALGEAYYGRCTRPGCSWSSRGPEGTILYLWPIHTCPKGSPPRA